MRTLPAAPGAGWLARGRPSGGGGYLHKLHIAEDVHRVVRGVEVVAAAAQLRVAPAEVTALAVWRLGAVQPAAARRGPVYCRWWGRGTERRQGKVGGEEKGRERETGRGYLLRARRPSGQW